MAELRTVLAPNSGAFTLDGTRTFLVGRERVALVDPGPSSDVHLRRLLAELEDASETTVLVTHDHADHSGGAEELCSALGVAPGGVLGDEPLEDGNVVETDAGSLVAVATPGHASPHLSFHWPDAGAVFVGDLLLGEGSTTWVGAYPGCVGDYLGSLARVEALDANVLYPAHGPPVFQVRETLERFRSHRLDRLERLGELRASHPDASPEKLAGLLYGAAEGDLRYRAVSRSVEAMLYHLEHRA